MCKGCLGGGGGDRRLRRQVIVVMKGEMVGKTWSAILHDVEDYAVLIEHEVVGDEVCGKHAIVVGGSEI